MQKGHGGVWLPPMPGAFLGDWKEVPPTPCLLGALRVSWASSSYGSLGAPKAGGGACPGPGPEVTKP